MGRLKHKSVTSLLRDPLRTHTAGEAITKMLDRANLQMGKAAHRIGRTTEDELKWVLDFAQCDLTALTSVQQNRLRWEVTVFPSRSATTQASTASSLSFEAVQRLQDSLRVGLKRVVRREPWTVNVSTGWDISLSDKHGDLIVRPTRSTFMGRVVEILSTATRRVLQCPGCNRFFVKHHKRKYCSPQCSDRNRVRVYRQRHKKRRPTQASFLADVPRRLPTR